MPPLDSKQCVCQTIRVAPKGSKLLRSENRGAGGVFCVFGVFRKPLEFVKVAKSLWHPFDTMVQLPDLLLKAIFEQLTLSPLELSKLRLERLSKWRQWSVELQQEEQQARAKMHPNVRKVLGQKRTVLLERIAESLNWPGGLTKVCATRCVLDSGWSAMPRLPTYLGQEYLLPTSASKT